MSTEFLKKIKKINIKIFYFKTMLQPIDSLVTLRVENPRLWATRVSKEIETVHEKHLMFTFNLKAKIIVENELNKVKKINAISNTCFFQGKNKIP
jgi:hypothetical protein